MKFNDKSYDEKIEIISKMMYISVHVIPQGFPNGALNWEELPEINADNSFLGADKIRFKEAAISILHMIGKA
jgi:hypothetical protein